MAGGLFKFIDPDGREEVARRRKNPDGSLGGWTAESANVDSTAVVELDAIVEPGAVVGPGVTVKNGTVVTGPITGS